jgi:hypothetical protein
MGVSGDIRDVSFTPTAIPSGIKREYVWYDELWEILQTWQVVNSLPSDSSLCQVSSFSPLVAFLWHPWKRESCYFLFLSRTPHETKYKMIRNIYYRGYPFFIPGKDIFVSHCWMGMWDSQTKFELSTKNLGWAFIPLQGHRGIPR